MTDAVRGPSGAGRQSPCSWRLRRNCRLAPERLIAATLLAALPALVAAVGFARLGYPVIALFAALQAALVAACLAVFVRHAVDGERVSIAEERLHLERIEGVRLQRECWPLHAARVMPIEPNASGVVLVAGGRRHVVGRHATPAQRAQFVRELGAAVRQGA